MKIRKGFISNSSTSSFLIYGVCIEDFEQDPKLIERYKKDENIEESDEDIDYYELGEYIEKKTGFNFYRLYDEELYIGRSWSSIKDDETGKEFKESIEKKLKEFFGDDINCSTYEEAWRDG